jgi:hypothetical protein
MATSAEATRAADRITFAHNSERQFARLLDFYRVEWEYEPTAFPIEWDAAGQPVQHFRPDFYLPGFRLYIEITTLNQRLVTKKNRKVRRLRELYPDVRIKVLYQRDYLSLLAKYGLEPPSQMLPSAEAAGLLSELRRPPGQVAERGAATRRDRVADPGIVGRRDRDAEPGDATRRERAAGPGDATRRDRAAGPGPSVRRGGAVERARAAGRPRVVPDPPRQVPPLPADPELVRLAQVLLPAEKARRRGPAAAERAG